MRTSRIFVGFFNAPVFFVFWLKLHTVNSDQLSAPKEVKAEEGGSVTVACHYDRQFSNNTKYWCKGSLYETCRVVVKTSSNQHSGKWSIADDKEAGIFTVTMSSLRQRDQHVYWCVIERPGLDVFTRVKLFITNAVTTHTDATPINPPVIQEEAEKGWWVTLRWIIFFLMLCCLVSTHIAVWRIKTAQKTQLHHNLPSQNIYE